MMANGRAMRRARLRKAARGVTELFGCTCPKVDVVTGIGKIDGLDHAAVYHDDGCAAIVGRVIAVFPRGLGRCER